MIVPLRFSRSPSLFSVSIGAKAFYYFPTKEFSVPWLTPKKELPFMTPPTVNDHHEQNVHVGTPDVKGRKISPWAWVASVNFAQGLQYSIVTGLFLTIFISMGIPNGVSVFWASMLGWPWVLKPLWGPLVERYWTKRNWTVWMQFIIFISLLGCAASFLLPESGTAFIKSIFGSGYPPFFYISVVCLIIMAFASSTHDIACDGYYMLSLTEKQQSYFVGIRSTAFRIAMIVANGMLIGLAFVVVQSTGPTPTKFTVTSVLPNSAAARSETEPANEILPAVFRYEGEPTQELELRVSKTLMTQDGGTTGSVMINLTRPPKEGYSEAVYIQPEPSKNLLKRIFLSSDTKGFSTSKDKGRLEFTTENWREGQEVIINFPKKITSDVTLTYTASAGDLAMGWAVALGLCALIYLVFFLYHSFIMPYPVGDGGAPTTTHFIRPLAAVFLTVGLPVLLVGLYVWGINFFLHDKLKSFVFGKEISSVESKGFDFFFAATYYLVFIGIVWFMMNIETTRSFILGFFKSMSRFSEIGFYDVFESFFQKPGIAITLGFLLTFRLGEAQLSQLKTPFLLGERATGALGMGLDQFALTNTLYYLGFLTVGGILSGLTIAKFGLKRMIWPCVMLMHLPNSLYIYLAYVQPTALLPINTIVAIEAFGYGFGFASYLLVMIIAAQGPYKTAHYALCTGFMALGMLIPGLWSGFLQELTGYTVFFILVMVFCIPGVLFIPFLKIDNDFGKKAE